VEWALVGARDPVRRAADWATRPAGAPALDAPVADVPVARPATRPIPVSGGGRGLSWEPQPVAERLAEVSEVDS
jgi:hypothetical protein